MKKIILHLCADIGTDTRYYDLDDCYDVIKVGVRVGVQNYSPPSNVYGVIANPVCTDFSAANHNKESDTVRGMFLVNHCFRIIADCNPKFWVLENPATGTLRDNIGSPEQTYQPWQFGDPWTKKTALWGCFNMPDPTFKSWESVPKNKHLYTKPKRKKPSLADQHVSAIKHLKQYKWCANKIKCDADIRSLCSDGFAKVFKSVNL